MLAVGLVPSMVGIDIFGATLLCVLALMVFLTIVCPRKGLCKLSTSRGTFIILAKSSCSSSLVQNGDPLSVYGCCVQYSWSPMLGSEPFDWFTDWFKVGSPELVIGDCQPFKAVGIYCSSIYSDGYRGSFSGIKRPQREADRSAPSRAEVKNMLNQVSQHEGTA